MNLFFKFAKPTQFLAVLAMALLVMACDKEDDPEPLPATPTIALQGDSEIIVKSGETIDVALTLNAAGGSRSLIVNKNGGFLEEVALTESQTSYTYSNESVPADAEEGEEFGYEFILVDQQAQESAPVGVTVSTARYDLITVAGESLYDATITTDGTVPSGYHMKLISGRNYFIGSSLEFEANTSLTIEAGVHVYLDKNADSPVEISVEEGVNVSIVGTADNPVVFTSSGVLDGTAEPNDWDRFRYGDVQNGVFQYVRSEYADQGIRFGDTDDSNTVDHLTTYHTGGEGFYFTNGNVNARYLVAVNSEGGSFRLGDAYEGKIQFAIGMIGETFTDNQELDIREVATPTLANVTLIGPGIEAENTHGVRLRASSQGKIYNAIVASFPRRGVRLNDDVQVTDLDGETVFAYSYVFDVDRDPFRDDTDLGNPFQGYTDEDGNYQNPFFNNITGLDEDGDPILVPIEGIGPGDFIPAEKVEAVDSFDPSTVDSWFTSVNYVGAVEDEADDWTLGWVKNPDGSIR